MNYSELSLERKKAHNRKCYINQKKSRNKRKLYLLNLIGGPKCLKCNYNKCLAALTFHHLNPEEKSFGLDVRSLYSKSLELLEKEAKKCIVLCANCHLEEHYL